MKKNVFKGKLIPRLMVIIFIFSQQQNGGTKFNKTDEKIREVQEEGAPRWVLGGLDMSRSLQFFT